MILHHHSDFQSFCKDTKNIRHKDHYHQYAKKNLCLNGLGPLLGNSQARFKNSEYHFGIILKKNGIIPLGLVNGFRRSIGQEMAAMI